VATVTPENAPRYQAAPIREKNNKVVTTANTIMMRFRIWDITGL
jgi:hypothetical protein